MAGWLGDYMQENPLVINPVFGALARPAMTAGVTLEYHMLNLMVSMCVFILVSPLYGLVFVPLHIFGWTVCRYDQHFFVLCFKKFALPPIPNKGFQGVRSYEPF